jgi:tetratricopeptide (TPR) repeat protein
MAEKRGRILALAESVEELPIGLGRWLLILASIVVVRHFLEQLSALEKTLYFLSYFIHYPLAYLAPLLALSVLLAALSRERVERVTRLMLFAWLLTLLPPLIDLAIARASETPQLIGYLLPRSATLWDAFVNLFNPAFTRFQGTTAGIRIEAALGCVLGSIYVFLKTRSPLRTGVAFVAIYATMFFFFALPPIVLAVSRLFGADPGNVYLLFFGQASVHRAFANATPFAVSDLSNALVDLLVIVPILAVWLRMYSRQRFAALLATIDLVQVGFLVSLTVVGLVLAARLLMASRGLPAVAHPFDAISIAGIVAASFFAAATASVARITLARPPSKVETAERRELLETAAFFFAFACLFALSVSYVTLTYVLTVLAITYLAYAPPLRLSRFPALAGFAVGAAGLFSLELGYSAYAGGAASLWIPRSIVFLTLAAPTLALLGRDVWEGRVPGAGRPSPLRALGATGARWLALSGIILASLLPAIALRQPLLLVPGALVGGAGALLVVRGRPSRVPAGLGGLAALFVIVAFVMGSTEAPSLRHELDATGFKQAARKAGTFELTGTEGGTETETLMNEGQSLFGRGDFQSAADAFRRVIESDPENVMAYLSIGSAYMRLDRLSEAARAFRKAMDIEPDNVFAHVGLGQTYKLEGDIDNALLEIDRALKLDPESAEATYTLAIIYGEGGDAEREFEALTKTVSLDPKNGSAQSRLADIFLAKKMYPEAIAALKAALGGRTAVEYVHTRLADAYYSMGDLASAENELGQEIAVKPKAASPHAVLARLLTEQGRRAEAIHELEQAIALTGDAKFKARLEEELRTLRK